MIAETLVKALLIGLFIGFFVSLVLPGGISVKVDGIVHNVQLVRTVNH